MRRTKLLLAALAVSLLVAASFTAMANWQGTWHYYDDEGVLVGEWTAGCRELDGRWGIETDNKTFTQGCRVTSAW